MTSSILCFLYKNDNFYTSNIDKLVIFGNQKRNTNKNNTNFIKAVILVCYFFYKL